MTAAVEGPWVQENGLRGHAAEIADAGEQQSDAHGQRANIDDDFFAERLVVLIDRRWRGVRRCGQGSDGPADDECIWLRMSQGAC